MIVFKGLTTHPCMCLCACVPVWRHTPDMITHTIYIRTYEMRHRVPLCPAVHRLTLACACVEAHPRYDRSLRDKILQSNPGHIRAPFHNLSW